MNDFKQVWVADQGDGTYINPIIHADYSDPDVVRVGDDFFMTASSFVNTPALPILHSRDLVNWKLVNHAVKKLPFPGYEKVQHGQGVWAPSIRYHDNKLWIFFGAPDEGIFMTNTEDPFGEWSDLVCVKEGKGLIDTCPFWDDDGQAYLVHAYARSRAGIKHRLVIQRMKPDGTALLGEPEIVYDDPENHPTLEGPKMYKRNGYYYIFAPAGGVSTGWQTILRSKEVFGPYEDKIVLHQGNTDINGPHQGGLIELDSGESWFIHFQDKGAYGRISHLQPVQWKDDWPLMGTNIDESGKGEPVIRWPKPNVGKEYPQEVVDTSDDFTGKQLALQWQWQANYNDDWYELAEQRMRLFSYPISHDKQILWYAPNLLMQKFPALSFQATTKLNLTAENEESLAGLAVIGWKYGYLGLNKVADKYQLKAVLGDGRSESEELAEQVTLTTNEVYLRVVVEADAKCQFSYSLDGEKYQTLGPVFTPEKGHWIGTKVGIFCVNNSNEVLADYGDFQFFAVTEELS